MIEALTRAGLREIGGVLMGEHVGVDTFRVRDITIQYNGGTFAAFVRFVEGILGPLQAFFRTTKHDYTRFNYIGEWHSHHSFALRPSGRDDATMRDIVDDPQLGAHFIVLLLAKLNNDNRLEFGVTVYQPGARPLTGVVQEESATTL
jgi:hypothetical protein